MILFNILVFIKIYSIFLASYIILAVNLLPNYSSYKKKRKKKKQAKSCAQDDYQSIFDEFSNADVSTVKEEDVNYLGSTLSNREIFSNHQDKNYSVNSDRISSNETNGLDGGIVESNDTRLDDVISFRIGKTHPAKVEENLERENQTEESSENPVDDAVDDGIANRHYYHMMRQTMGLPKRRYKPKFGYHKQINWPVNPMETQWMMMDKLNSPGALNDRSVSHSYSHSKNGPIIYSINTRRNTNDHQFNKYKGIDRKPETHNSFMKSRRKISPETRTPRMISLEYDTMIISRYARTTVTGSIQNYGSGRDININVILPRDALITKFETSVGQNLMKAFIMEKKRTSSFLETDIFGMNVGTMFVEARDCDGIAVTVHVPKDVIFNYTVTYEYVLIRNLGVYSVPIIIHNNMWIRRLIVKWRIEEERKITKLLVPLIHKTTDLPDPQSEDFIACIRHEGTGTAEVIWHPTLKQQNNISKHLGLLSSNGVVGRLLLWYDVDRSKDPCGQIVVRRDYFAHFFSPPNQPPLRKHVIFVLDLSDSMKGDPIEHLKKALSNILDTLLPMDNFTLINFSDEVEIININDYSKTITYRGIGKGLENRGKNTGKTRWPGNLWTYQATSNNIEAAKIAIKSMKLRVFTNIYDAMIMGFKALHDLFAHPPSRMGQAHPEPMIIFLTDGHASDGPSYDDDVIVKMVEDQNHYTKSPIFALGIGGEADMKLLRRFALATNGMEKHIYKDKDSTEQLVYFFQSIQEPVLKDLYFKYNSNQVKTSTLTDQSFPIIHRGREVIISGQLNSHVISQKSLYADVTGIGRFAMIKCERLGRNFHKPGTKGADIRYSNTTAYRSLWDDEFDIEENIVERIWGYKTLMKLRDEIEIMVEWNSHQNTDCDDQLKPTERMLEISLRLNYAMPTVTNFIFNGTIIERFPISPETKEEEENPRTSDPLTQFPWILKLRDKHGFAKLPIASRQTDRMYMYLSLGISKDPLPTRSCPDASDGSPGECRYLPECSDPRVLGTPNKFRKYFCRLGSYAGVCCSQDFPKPIASTNSSK